MCIIAAKPRNTKMPSESIMKNMFANNPDGAGFMYVKENMVRIEKGFMTYTSFSARIEELEHEINTTTTPIVFHFRIATHGGIKAQNCHPFPVSDSEGMLKKLKVSTKLGVVHNGIIDIAAKKDISDTMAYIASQLAPLYKGVPKFYKNKHLMEMVSNAIDSKMVLMDEIGSLYTIGDFTMDEGILYSNKSYAYEKTIRSYDYGCYEWDTKDYYSSTERILWGYMNVMWLDECEGEYVKNKGYMESGEYAIDAFGNVYEYDYDADMLIKLCDFEAFTSNGTKVKFDEDSPMCTRELIYNG